MEVPQDLSNSDARIRPIMNGDPHGQCPNHNTALKLARGEWIKILHDDDVLKPNCLEVLAYVVRRCRNIIAVSCACDQFVDGNWSGRSLDATGQSLNKLILATLFWQCISSINQGGRYPPNKWCIARLWSLVCSSKRHLASIL